MSLPMNRFSRRTLRALVCCHCVLSMIQFSLTAEVKLFQWEVEYIYWSADCLERVMIGINGQFPGPTIRSKVGDTIVVRLTNKLSTEGVTLHWHGIKQYGTPWADGTASISQCPINPGETFEYRFLVDKAGTYFYHGHYGLQRSAGLYGSLIVDLEDGKHEPFHYDGEFSLLLSDLWHKTTAEQEAGLNSIPFRWVGEPQSLLINGRGQYNCSLASHFINNSSLSQCSFIGNEQCAPEFLTVLPNKTYRVRIASITALASLNLAIGNHKMLVVEADGNYVQPFEVTDLDIYSGESYSVLVSTNQDPSHNYWISVGVRAREPQTPQSLAILNYHQNHALDLPTSPPPFTPLWNDFNRSKSFSKQIVSLMGSPKPPPNSDHRIRLLNTQNYINGHLKWAINNISLSLPETPYLGAIKYGLKVAFNRTNPPENYSRDYDLVNPPVNPEAKYGNGVYMLGLNTTVDVILQNANMLAKNKSEVHPWHIHGHEFWVLAYGEGRFTPEDEKVFNLNNPPLKNTAVVFPYGWTALRFKADNPGVWPFHCHIEPHFHLGMGVVFAVEVQYVKGIPREALACGLTSRVFDMGGN